MTNEEGVLPHEGRRAVFARDGNTLRVGKRVYGIGLQWESCDASPKIKSIARDSAKASGADLFCVRPGSTVQYGLGSIAAGHKPGMPSLAATLLDALGGSFVGIFRVDSGYYLAAAREEKVLATCDRLFESEDAASELFQSLIINTSWDQKICPKEWGVDDATCFSLEDALNGQRARTKLEQTSQVSMAIRVGGVLSILVLVVGGVLVYEKHKADMADEQRAAIERARAMEKARLEALKHRTILPALPWEGNPLGYYTLAECVDKILATKIDVAGWRAENITCSLQPAQVSPDIGKRPIVAPAALAMKMVLKRDGGTINWIGESLNTRDFHPEVIQTGSAAAVIWKTSFRSPVFPPEGMGDKETSAPQGNLLRVSKYLITNFDELFTDIDIKEAAGRPVKINVPRGNPISATLERHIAFTFQTKDNPKSLNNIFFPVAGLVVDKVELDLKSWEWSVGGDVYERIPLPAQSKGGR